MCLYSDTFTQAEKQTIAEDDAAGRDRKEKHRFKKEEQEKKEIAEKDRQEGLLRLAADKEAKVNNLVDDADDIQAPLLTKPLSELSVDDVIHLLKSLNLRKYCAVFQENDIDGPTLMCCNKVEDVKELGIDTVAKARLLFNKIIELKSTEVS